MIGTDKDKKLDRRASSQDSEAYTRGISRLESTAAEAFRAHDEECHKLDPAKWFTAYSLLDHHIKVAEVMTRIGEARGRSKRDILIGRIAALLHDAGKLEDECRIYRLNRKLTGEERIIMARHSELSNQFIENCMRGVREVDRALLAEVRPVVAFHHHPWKVSDLRLRQITYDLKFTDIFVSLQENRERPGLGLGEAIEALDELDICREDPQNSYNLPMIWASKRVILHLYGIDFVEISAERPGA